VSTTPLRVVFADDDEAMRTLVSTLLQLADGVEVVGQAVDGAEAVELVRDLDPDLVLLDVQMPRLDGPEAAEVIRALRPRTQIVLHTAMPSGAVRDQAARLGVPLLDKMRFDDVIDAVTGHARVEEGAAQPDPRVEAAVLGALTARAAQPMFLVLPDGTVPFYNSLAADLLDLPLPAQPSSMDELRRHFRILRPDGTFMPVPERLMYRAIDAHTPLTEPVVVAVGDRRTRCRAAAIPFYASDGGYVGVAIYFERLD
jgi:CheY-like chemotaxis protein